MAPEPEAAPTTPERRRLHGHWWTVWPTLRDRMRPPRAPLAVRVRFAASDERFGPIELSAELRSRPERRDLVLLVHGLGGSCASGYVQRAAAEFDRLGFASLALNLRGADRSGAGVYNVALHEDLAAACCSDAAAPFERIFVLGFSMGGHTAIHFAAATRDPRVAGAAAVCTPLDLQQAQRHIDQPRRAAYRHYALGGLKEIYAAAAARRSLPSPVRDVLRCRTIHDWDRLVIAPLYGFADPESFYAASSARRVLPNLRVPVRLVLAASDPVIPHHLALPWVRDAAPGMLAVHAPERGGHLYFPSDLDLGMPGGRGLTAQLATAWLRAARAS